MTAKEFIRQVNRMCEYYVENNSCVKCPANNIECFGGPSADEQLVDIVEKWTQEHPVKTRQSEFLKMFPNADLVYVDGIQTLNICPVKVDNRWKENCSEYDCRHCYKDYWLEEIE